MPRWNGGVIGAANNPTTSSAKGIWSLSEATKAIRAGLWPPSNAGADPYFENVTMLLSADGTNGAQNNTFLDSSTNAFTITRNGNTTQGTFTPFSKPDGRWSMYQSDSASNYINFTTSAGTLFQFTGDYTIEMWVYITSISGDGSLYVASDNSNYHALNIDATNYNIWLNAGSATSSFAHGLTLNTWNHIAMVRNGSTITVYTNGVSKGTIANSSTNGYSSPAIARNGGGAAHVGYINGYRVVKGTAVYTAAFTPPTAPLTAISGTSLLTGQNNRFIDNSSNALAITLSGTPSIQTFSPFPALSAYDTSVNGGSGYFDGTGDYLTATANNAFNFGTGDFTVEGWIYPTRSGLNAIWTNGAASSGSFGVGLNSTNKLQMDYYGGTSLAGATSVQLNAWNYFAFVRSGSNLYVYLNGVRDGSTTTSSNNSTNSFTLGRFWTNDATNETQGYISDFRISDATALYTASTMTVPTTPTTAIASTSILLNFTNGGIVDAAMSNDLETVGGASISTTQSKFGGSSMYFDGNGDYLRIRDSQNFVFGTGDFTIEFWVYYNSGLTADVALFDGRPSGTNGVYPLIFSNTTGKLVWYINSAARITGTTTLSTGTWYHVAVARSGTSTKLFLNGTQESSTYTDSNSYLLGTDRPIIAAAGATLGADPLNGYIDDLRVTKGYARYTANFTAPVGPFNGFGD
jgi:hypothetical protein